MSQEGQWLKYFKAEESCGLSFILKKDNPGYNVENVVEDSKTKQEV